MHSHRKCILFFYMYKLSLLVCRHKVFEEAGVVFGEEAEVFYLILQVRNALYAHTEGITFVLLAINAVCFEHIGVYHSATEDFNPSCAFAEGATFTAADVAAAVHFG